MSEPILKVKEIIPIISSLAVQYFELGIQLGLEDKQIKIMEQNMLYTSSVRRLTEVIIMWRDNDNCDHPYCWSTLAEAVKRIGGHDRLARELEARDMTNTMPKVIKTNMEQYEGTESADDTGYSSKTDSFPGNSFSELELPSFEPGPGCGCPEQKSCSLYKVCAGECPNPTNKKVAVLRKKSEVIAQNEIPFEEDNDIEDYEKNTKIIRKAFGKLVVKTCRSFKAGNVNIEEFTLFLLATYPSLNPRADELNRASNFEQVFKIIIDQTCSWFDYELIKDVVSYFTPQNTCHVDQYEEKFMVYLKERLPKGKKHIEVGNSGRKGSKKLVIKIDEEWENVNFQDLDKLRASIALVLGVHRRDLYVADIREGCIMITFMVSKDLILLPAKNNLSSSQISSLQDNGVISLIYGKLSWRSDNMRHQEQPVEVYESGEMHGACPWCQESSWVETHKNYLAHLETFGRQSEGRSSPVTMVVVGREGAGKSSLIKNTFRNADCNTGDRAYRTTHEAKLYQQTEREGNERAVTLHIIDSPGLGGIDNNIKKFKKELSQVTNKEADVILYCVSMHDGGRIDATDVSIIKALTAALGKDIWKHTFLLLTFANTRKISDEDYKLLVEDYAEQFQKALNRAYIFDSKVRSIFSEPHPDKSSIPAIPVGYDPQEPLPLCSNWSDHLFMEVIARSDPKVARQLLRFKTVDPQQVVEVVGSTTAIAAAGTAIVGAAAGAPLLGPGIVVGAAAGGILGGTVGPNILTKLKNMFLLKRSQK